MAHVDALVVAVILASIREGEREEDENDDDDDDDDRL